MCRYMILMNFYLFIWFHLNLSHLNYLIYILKFQQFMSLMKSKNSSRFKMWN